MHPWLRPLLALAVLQFCRPGAGAQTGVQATAPASPARVFQPTPMQRTVTFMSARTVLGAPDNEELNEDTRCSSDGLTYLHALQQADHADPRDLFSVSTDGGVQRLHRAMPKDEPVFTIRDFFAGEDRLITLIEAGKPDAYDTSAPPREMHPYLSLSDHDGSNATVLPLDIHFTPVKVAQFGSGDFLVLGWDSANRLPLLAVLKPDGTVRRFLEPDEIDPEKHLATQPSAQPPNSASAPASKLSATQPEPAAGTDSAVRKALDSVVFFPSGKDILLTYPGTTRPLRLLGDTGQNRSIPMHYPTGTALRDVLNTGDRRLIVRLKKRAEPDDPHDLLVWFEGGYPFINYGLKSGAKEVDPYFVTCAAHSTFTAILPTALSGDAASTSTAGRQPNQWIITTARQY